MMLLFVRRFIKLIEKLIMNDVCGIIMIELPKYVICCTGIGIVGAFPAARAWITGQTGIYWGKDERQNHENEKFDHQYFCRNSGVYCGAFTFVIDPFMD